MDEEKNSKYLLAVILLYLVIILKALVYNYYCVIQIISCQSESINVNIHFRLKKRKKNMRSDNLAN